MPEGFLALLPRRAPANYSFGMGHVCGVTQEDKASHSLWGLEAFWAHTSAPRADLLYH
jgi:hypothetical protein